MQPTASNGHGPPPLRWRAGTPAANPPSIVQEDGNNGSWVDRALNNDASPTTLDCAERRLGKSVQNQASVLAYVDVFWSFVVLQSS